ncbi:hypothetical protein ACFL3V_06535 [Nanoarchaeota archaeon]
MGIGKLVKQIWKHKAKTVIVGGALLSVTSMGSAIGYSLDKDYTKAAGAGLTCIAFAFSTGWYSRNRYARRKEEKQKKAYEKKDYET